MYRERTLLKVTPEGWNPTIQAFNRLSEIARERGDRTGTRLAGSDDLDTNVWPVW